MELLGRDGYAIAPRVLDEPRVSALLTDVEFVLSDSPAGVRDLATKVASVRALALSRAIRELVEPVLGVEARLVRSILFSKSADTNWQVGWHQDLAIAVAERAEVEGFGSWSTKEGIPHVQPPVRILESMLTVRVHLDAADHTNGALWVVPGSHRLGRLPASSAGETAERLDTRLCSCNVGDALLIRPLTLHSSRKVTSDRPRRVIHLEFAGVDLPSPLAWAQEAVSIDRSADVSAETSREAT